MTPVPTGRTAAVSLAESYARCRELTRRTAGNFGYTFLALPADRRREMEAIYAFMRVSDDLADDESVSVSDRRESLAAWRRDLDRALAAEPVGRGDAGRYLPAVADVVSRRAIPHEHLHAVLDGVVSDLDPRQPADFTGLEAYCYRVAGAVGLCCIHVWGFRDPDEAIPAAVDCGLALQLTNILRDVREDAAAGRVYLPADRCAAYGVTAETFLAGVATPDFLGLMRDEVARAKAAYARGRRLLPLVDPVGRPVLRAMLRLYGGILGKIDAEPARVLRGRTRLPAWRKAGIAATAMLGR